MLDTRNTSNSVWTTALGEQKLFSEIDHQHLSNILWFNEVLNGWNKYNSESYFSLDLELHKRFRGVKLEWKPLPIPHEIEFLKNLGLIDSNNDIIFQGKKIGTIKHIL